MRATPVPCANRPGDVVGLVLEGSGAPAGTVVVLGHPFRPGDLPAGATLTARLADGRPLTAQADITTRHPDGSARFAVVSLAAPALRGGERAGVVLARGANAGGAPMLDTVAAGAGHSALLEIAPGEGAAPWRVDLLLRMQDAVLMRPPHALWQAGPLAVQARLELAVPREAVGGATSARLVADVALRADGTLWTDVWLRNDIAMREDGGPAHYTMRVLLDGREALKVGPLRQFQYTGFGRLLGSARTGAAPQPPLVRHDIAYLADTAAIARYDLSIGVEERALQRMAQAMAVPEWAEPFNPRGITRAMPMAGNRPDIGPVTRWQAAWLVSGDVRAAAFCIGQAEAAGAVPWHFWDPRGGDDGRGGWMDTKRWPEFWADPRGRPPRGLLQPVAHHSETGWQPDTAHKPALAFVPYLLTGRRAFLDGVMAEAVWGVLSSWPARRAEFGDVPAVRDVNVVAVNQIRGGAWCLRCLDNAAWIAPDDHPNAAYVREVTAANWAWLRSMTGRWGAIQGQARGWIIGNYALGANGEFSPWQQDFFVSSVAAAARRGNADARLLLAWMENFVAGRFLAERAGFNPRDGIAYQIVIAPAGGPNPAYFQTWAEIGAETLRRQMSNESGWRRSTGYYGPLGRYSLTMMVEVLDSAPARQALAWLTAAAPPYTRPQDFADDPTYSIVLPGTRGRSCAG